VRERTEQRRTQDGTERVSCGVAYTHTRGLSLARVAGRVSPYVASSGISPTTPHSLASRHHGLSNSRRARRARPRAATLCSSNSLLQLLCSFATSPAAQHRGHARTQHPRNPHDIPGPSLHCASHPHESSSDISSSSSSSFSLSAAAVAAACPYLVTYSFMRAAYCSGSRIMSAAASPLRGSVGLG